MRSKSKRKTPAHLLSPPTIFFLLRINNLGGAELSMLAVARGLSARGWHVGVAVYGSRRELVLKHDSGLDIIYFDAVRTLAVMAPLFQALRKRRPSLLITALQHTNLIGIIVAALARSDTRVIVTEHSPSSKTYLNSQGWKYRILQPLIGCIYPFADAIVAVSQGIASDLRKMLFLSRPVQVIYNPAVKENMLLPSCDAIPHPWLAERSTPVIMGIGRFSREKNFSLLLNAFALLASRRSARLIILGEGEERAALVALAEKLGISRQVLFAGFVDHVDVWLRHAAVFVLPSSYEGFGNVIVEAMACGVPVVATDCPVGPAEILENGKWGRMVPVNDAAAMAAAIEDTLDHPTDAEAAKQRALMFTEQHCIDSYVALIRPLV